ncbi:PREDICTED: rho GTPase-activating protein 190 isoform X5 [Nicrophorus vespilloides]|uniref:Rho GTPase-activating protein 190 isoform X5 n=1 Tax=Nicrophorus vespilloides TaxID=110193 RepID=A0ABM1M1J8_NICVS|nr:PREDICTED: rho GTPase-activating protein 190 isoform X5 [Nicrophorus vespilloides]
MARKVETVRSICVAVVGLSGMEKDKGHAGVGKSCMCNRFMRSVADDYNVDHISVLSQTDFSGRVVNNDHFLYWGEVIKTSDEGVDYQFSIIEQTEFIDDASFQPFKGGKMEPYVKRCASTKIQSAEKLMYICKNQLGIEKEYEQKVLPDGKLNIDGFICIFDVSVVPSRSIEKQIEFVAAILNNLVKTKKPIVLVTTKNDDANELFIREADKLVQRKEYKGAIPLVETSAHDNVNVDLAFLLLAQMVDRSKVRSKLVSYLEASRARKELMDAASEAFLRLIKIHVTDCRALWSQTVKKLNSHKEWTYFVQLVGLDGTQKLFRRHIKKLKDEQLARRVAQYMEMLPDVLHELVPDINTFTDSLCFSDWPSIQQYLKTHPDFSQYFYECPEDMPWTECELNSDNEDSRIPYDVLDTSDAETVYKNHVNVLQQEQKRLEMPKRWKKQFKQLLEDTGYVTPGKHLSEVRVLFMGRECFEALSEHDCQQIYDAHQRELIENAKHNFQELLLENADLFYHFKSIAPTGTITQDDIKEITDVLQDDFRYKMLDRLDQDRKLMLFQHLGFVHCPIREHCPAFPNCMDALIERILATKAHRPSSWNRSTQWLLTSDNNQLNLVILGINHLAEDLSMKIREQCEDDEYKIDGQFYSLDYRIITGDVSLPHNSFRTSEFVPHGSFCVYSNAESFEYIRDSLEKTLLSNLEQEDKLPFQGLPIVIMFIPDSFLEEKDILKLREEGQSLADSLQCPFMDICLEQITDEQLVSEALHELIQSIHHRAGFLNYQVIECAEPDIRIIMCMFCGDPFSVENVLAPLLSHQCCFLSAERSIILETYLGDSKRKVEVIISSFHGANAFRDELVHGFILVYSTKRKASFATLNAFSMNIPNLPIQIMAVTEGGANAYFNSELTHLLIAEGNNTADRLHAHFVTSNASCQQKTAFYTPFFKEVWDKKPEIEQAFHMEEPAGLVDSGEGTLEHPRSQRAHPLPPPRHESYHLKHNDGSGSENYEHLADLNGPEERLSSSDHSDKYSQIYQMYGSENGDIMSSKKRHLHSGFQVYPPPTTPPEPAPPDHLMNSRTSKRGQILSASQTSLDEITSDISGSRESLATHDSDGDAESHLPLTSGWNNYGQHAFTTGRRHVSGPKARPKGVSQTLKRNPVVFGDNWQPGKLNLKNFSVVTEAIARMNVSGKDSRNSNFGNAPLATPEVVDLGSEYAQVKDIMYPQDAEYMYTLVHDAVSGKSKLRQRREKGQPSYSDTDSEWSSLERRQRQSEVYSKVNRKTGTHKRTRKKRTAIPVQPPRVPPKSAFTMSSAHSAPPVDMDSEKTNLLVPTESNTDSSEGSENGHYTSTTDRMRFGKQRSFSLKKRLHAAHGVGCIQQDLHNTHNLTMPLNSPDLFSSKVGSYGLIHDDESSLDVSSPRDNHSPMSSRILQFDALPKMKESDREKLLRKREKQKAKDDSKLEKRKQKEEKLRKVADKEKERDRKKLQKLKQKSGSAGGNVPAKLSDFIQSDNNYVPLFMEKCVKFIETEGLDSEGIYRVPGNRAHVDLLFQNFEEDQNVDIYQLDVPVNAVATALKDFVSKRLPPLFEENVMSELEDIAGMRMKPMATTTSNIEVKTDKSCRLIALRKMLGKLDPVNFQVLKFVFQHFVKVAENAKLNSMDSKNLAICWWPTLLPIEFSDMGRFEQMRPYLEDIVQTMIAQYPFLFCGKEAYVMV